MNQESRNKDSWYRGSLPNWMLVVLVGMSLYIGRQFAGRVESHESILAQHDTRVTVLESENRAFKDSLADLRLTLRDILIELKNRNRPNP